MNNGRGHKTIHPQNPDEGVIIDNPEVLYKEISTITSNQNKDRLTQKIK